MEDSIQQLLLETPQVVHFSVGQSALDRGATMELVPENVQNLTIKVMKHILDYDNVDYSKHPLIYFMATWDENITDDEVEYRQHSDDWRLIYFQNETGCIVDFCGWPGDNECGGDIYLDNNGTELLLFESFDGGLTPKVFPELMLNYYTQRMELAKDPDDE